MWKKNIQCSLIGTVHCTVGKISLLKYVVSEGGNWKIWGLLD